MPSRRIEAVAFTVGAASLGTEIAAARLLAPWFGASTIIFFYNVLISWHRGARFRRSSSTNDTCFGSAAVWLRLK